MVGPGFQEELVKLYFELLEQKVKDKYRGHQDIHIMLNAIHSRVPVVGGKINVQKQDRNGNIYTVTYHITVKDDLGNFLNSIEDMGGQCIKGEIVKKGYIFTCMECGEPFCRKHVKFVDNDFKKPLCKYGLFGWEGCYILHAPKYSVGNKTELDRLRHQVEKKKLLAELERADQEIDAAQKGYYIDAGQDQHALPPPKKTGTLGRLIHGNAHSIRCGNCWCGGKIFLSNIVCPYCRNTITIDVDAPLQCPVCGRPIEEIECPKCEGINKL